MSIEAASIRKEMLYGRPRESVKVFISSEMRSGDLIDARIAVDEAISETGFHHSWTWEKDGYAGQVCAKGLCVGNAETSDYLILILGRKLTPVTREEYYAAKAAAAQLIVFVPVGCQRTRAAQRFFEEEVTTGSYGEYTSPADLKRRVIGSLGSLYARNVRERQYERRVSLEGVLGVVEGSGLTR